MAERRGNTIRIPDGYFTSAQVAKKVRRSTRTVKNWRDADLLPADLVMDAGKISIYLYSPASLRLAEALARGGGRLPNGSLAA